MIIALKTTMRAILSITSRVVATVEEKEVAVRWPAPSTVAHFSPDALVQKPDDKQMLLEMRKKV